MLAGPEPERQTAWRLGLPPPRQTTPAGMRIGVWLEDPGCPMDGEVLDRLAGAGAKIEEAHPLVEFSHQVSVFNQLLLAAVSPSLPAEIAEAVSRSHCKWLRADQDRAGLRQVWVRWFEDFDLLMCPVLGVAAFPHNQEGQIIDRVQDVNGGTAPHIALLGWAGLIGCGRAAVCGRAGRADRRGIARRSATGSSVPARPRRGPGRTDGLRGPRRLPATAEHEQDAVGVSHHTNFPRPMTSSRIDVTATAIRQRRTRHLWQAGSTDAGSAAGPLVGEARRSGGVPGRWL